MAPVATCKKSGSSRFLELFTGGQKIRAGGEIAMQFRQMLNVLMAGIDSRAAA
jgi:hypothetical protein